MTKRIDCDLYSDLITSANPNEMPAGPRNGAKIEYIVIHHNAGTNKDAAMNTWVNGGTSAHYEVTPDEIIGCVGEESAAYHAGGTGANDVPNIPNINARSIGIEHVNSTGAPDWLVADATIRRSAKLVADICNRYGIPIDRAHIKRHGEITKTQCCGGLNVDTLVDYARGNTSGGTSGGNSGNTSAPSTPSTARSAIEKFKAAGNTYRVSHAFNVSQVKQHAGIWQLLSSDLGGDNWDLNGIPLACVTFVNNDGSMHANQTWNGSQPKFVFNQDVNHGTIDAYDYPTNAVGINFPGNYGRIWFNADAWLNG